MGRATRCLQEPCLCSAGFMRHPWSNNQDWIDWIVWIFGVCTASTNNPIVWPERIVCCRWSMLAARCLCLWRIPIGNKLKLEDLQMHSSAALQMDAEWGEHRSGSKCCSVICCSLKVACVDGAWRCFHGLGPAPSHCRCIPLHRSASHCQSATACMTRPRSPDGAFLNRPPVHLGEISHTHRHFAHFAGPNTRSTRQQRQHGSKGQQRGGVSTQHTAAQHAPQRPNPTVPPVPPVCPADR